MGRKRATAGDFLQLIDDEYFRFVQYLGVHSELGPMVGVIPIRFPEPPNDLVSVAKKAEMYPVAYPVPGALRLGLARICLNSAILLKLPDTVRRKGRIEKGGKVSSWFIDFPDGSTVAKKSLSESEREIPLGGCWNHRFLITRIDRGWHPRDDY